MTSLRPLDASAIRAPDRPPLGVGPRPRLAWLPLADLVVDDSYQRPIRGAGRGTIRRIAAKFRWSHFAPVIVAAAEGGKFTIIDGQHRATAALLAGMTEIPCQIVVATVSEQAEAFGAINGQVTRMSALALYRANLAAGERGAARIHRVARAAGVTVLDYPKSELNQEPGETMAVMTIGACLRSHGDMIVTLALKALTGTHNRVRGGLIGPIISATCAAVAAAPSRLQTPEALIAAFDRINVIHEYGKAQMSERAKGVAVWNVLAGRLTARLAEQRRAA